MTSLKISPFFVFNNVYQSPILLFDSSKANGRVVSDVQFKPMSDIKEKVVDSNELVIKLKFPFEEENSFQFYSTKGFTRQDIIDNIRTAYRIFFRSNDKSPSVWVTKEDSEGNVKSYQLSYPKGALFVMGVRLIDDHIIELEADAYPCVSDPYNYPF